MNRYTNIFQSAPFIRITLWFAAGILGHKYLPSPNAVWFYLVVSFFIAIIILSLKPNYRMVAMSNLFISFGLFFWGGWYAGQNVQYFSTIPSEKEFYSGYIFEKPVEKNKSYQSIMEISNPEKKIEEKVIVYFQKDQTVELLKPGSRIVFNSKFNRIRNRGNPFEFDYQAFMQKQGIVHSVYLKASDYKIRNSSANNLYIFAERCRDYLLSILKKKHITGEEYSVVAALTLGHRKELNQETRDYFASSGAMHVLAVSGLHVGIIYFIFTFLFSPLKKKKYGRLAYTLLVGSLIWIYAILTGLTPSVQRAAVMFCFILIGQNLNRPANIFNSLAASAFLLMLFNPFIIYEIGFQLSYLAVTGIVLFQPLFYQLYIPQNRLVEKLWVLLTVSLAAQLATFPLGLFYFSQFPNYFWLSNFIVIPAATLILSGTFLLFLLQPVPFVSDWIGIGIQKLTQLMLSGLKTINSLPYALTDQVSINSVQAILLLLIVAFGYWFVRSKSIQQLRLILLLTGGFFLASLVQNYGLLNQRKVIVYNSPSPVVQFIHGRESYVLYSPDQTSDEQLSRLLEGPTIRMKLNPPVRIVLSRNTEFRNNKLAISNDMILFAGKKIQVLKNKSVPFPLVDFRICEKYVPVESSHANLDEMTIVVGDTPKTDKRKFNIYQTSEDGAFIADFKEN